MGTLLLRCLVALGSLTAPLWSQQLLHSVSGPAALAQLGQAVSCAGDVNADGHDDFIASTTNAAGLAGATVYSGSDGAPLYPMVGAGPTGYSRSVSGAGDVNGDGYDDFIVGNGHAIGTASVYSGLDGSVLHTKTGGPGFPFDGFGTSVSGAGDVNADGYDDFIVGAPQADMDPPFSDGYASVFSGFDGSVLHNFAGGSIAGEFGIAVSGAGDVNDDGYDDVIVGARLFGATRVFSGLDGSQLHSLATAPAVSGAGDVNGDGFDDVIIGNGNANNFRGWAHVHSGANGATLYFRQGDADFDRFGSSVGGGGDVDGDGFDDFIVGAHWANGAAGIARLFSGSSGSTLHTFSGNGFFGWSVNGAGDVDGDGVADVIIGAPNQDANGQDSGEVVVHRLQTVGAPGWHRDHGAGCPGTDGHLPRIGVDDEPVINATFAFELRGAVPGAMAHVLLGTAVDIDLTVIGYPGCALLVDPLATLAAPVDAAGFATSPGISIPLDPALVGFTIESQWIVLDLANLAASNAATVHVGV